MTGGLPGWIAFTGVLMMLFGVAVRRMSARPRTATGPVAPRSSTPRHRKV